MTVVARTFPQSAVSKMISCSCFEDDFNFPLRELCVDADEVDVPGS